MEREPMKRTTLSEMLKNLEWLDDTIDRNRAAYSGWSMEADDEDDDTIEDPGDKDDEKSDDDDSEDDEEEPKLPTAEEWKKTQEALTKANAEAKKHRLALRAAKKTAASSEDTEDAAAKAEAAAAAKWKPKVVNSAAVAALAEAGARNPERLVKLVEHDDLDVDDDGTVSGLDDEVDRLKEDYPELFVKRRSGGKVETGDRGGDTKKKMTATERQAAALTGKSR
jgi:hypothetical protein